jgi:ribonuclease HI
MKIYNCYFDGSCEPKNPNGNMGWGVYITSEDKEFKKSRFYKAKIGNTCNIAEYLALIMIFKLMKNKIGVRINIYGDSKLVIMQTLELWKIKKGLYIPYAHQAIELYRALRKKNIITLQWIPRKENSIADELSKSKNTDTGVVNNNY